MELVVITPTYKTTLAIAWIEIETTVGNFVIQPGHAPTVLILQPNNLLTYCLTNGKQETITAQGGIVEITRTSALVILDS